MKQTVRLNEAQLERIIMESVKKCVGGKCCNDEELEEGVLDNLKTGAKTFFGKTGGLKDKWNAAKTNYNMQGEHDKIQDVIAKLSELVDARQIDPSTTIAQLIGGKYNGNKFGKLTGVMYNRRAQMNKNMR